jgi:hypothetical protein
MPCIFCIAVFMSAAATVTASGIELIQMRLKKKAATPVKKVADTESVAKFELGMKAAGKTVPVAITVFKEHKRVRIQVMSHEIPRAEAEKLENQIADLLDLKIIDRSHEKGEEKVREAFTETPRSDERPTTEGPAAPPVPERPR